MKHRKTYGVMRKSRRSQQGHEREIKRLLGHFAYWRRHRMDDPSDVVTHREIFTYNRFNINPLMVEYVLNHSKVMFHCLTISYCEDAYRNTYKLYGYAQTTRPICMLDDDIATVIYAARGHAESTANTKHIVAHAMVLAPQLPSGSPLGDLVVKLKDQLDLTDRDLNELRQCIDSQAVDLDVTSTPDLDAEIAQYLKHQ